MTKSDYSKFFSFVAFTIAAAILWFLFRYNDTYVEDTTVKIEWINIPVDIELAEKSRSIEVPVKVEASGFRLLWLNYFPAHSTLDFNQSVRSTNGTMTYSPKKSKSAMNEAVGKDIRIIEISEDAVSLQFQRYASKKVMLSKKFQVRYMGNYQQIGSSGFNVDQVTITGNDKKVAVIDSLVIKMDDIKVEDSLLERQVDLHKLFPDLKIEPAIVTYIAHAAEMTEGSMRIPITLLHKPDNAKVKLIPESVLIVFSTRLKHYNTVKSEDFKVTIDMDDINPNDATAVPIITTTNKFVNESRTQPQSVQILIIQ